MTKHHPNHKLIIPVIGTLLVIVSAAAFLPAQAVHPANPLGHGPEVIAAGQVIYNRTCTGCHGVDGGEGERAPALVGDRRFFRLSENSLFDTIKGGIPGTAMPPFNLPDEDIWRIVVWIRAMRGSASETVVPGDAALGAAVFSGKGGCLKCHTLNGRGGTIGPDLSNIGAEVTLKHLQQSLTQQRPIPPGYRPVTVATKSGETVEGIARNEDAFSIQILDYKGKLHLYDTNELRRIELGKTSLMPHNYDQVLTSNEYQGLVAMLARQAIATVHKQIVGEGEAGR